MSWFPLYVSVTLQSSWVPVLPSGHPRGTVLLLCQGTVVRSHVLLPSIRAQAAWHGSFSVARSLFHSRHRSVGLPRSGCSWMDATVAFLSLSYHLCTSTCLQNLYGRPSRSLLPFLVTLESTVDVTWTVWMHAFTLAMATFHPRIEDGSDPSNRVCVPIEPRSIGFEPGFESV